MLAARPDPYFQPRANYGYGLGSARLISRWTPFSGADDGACGCIGTGWLIAAAIIGFAIGATRV